MAGCLGRFSTLAGHRSMTGAPVQLRRHHPRRAIAARRSPFLTRPVRPDVRIPTRRAVFASNRHEPVTRSQRGTWSRSCALPSSCAVPAGVKPSEYRRAGVCASRRRHRERRRVVQAARWIVGHTRCRHLDPRKRRQLLLSDLREDRPRVGQARLPTIVGNTRMHDLGNIEAFREPTNARGGS